MLPGCVIMAVRLVDPCNIILQESEMCGGNALNNRCIQDLCKDKLRKHVIRQEFTL